MKPHDLIPLSPAHVAAIASWQVQHPEADQRTAWHATLGAGLSGAVRRDVTEPVLVSVPCVEEERWLLPSADTRDALRTSSPWFGAMASPVAERRETP